MTRHKYANREEYLKACNLKAREWMRRTRAAGFTQRKGPDGHWHFVRKSSNKYLKGRRPSRIEQ